MLIASYCQSNSRFWITLCPLGHPERMSYLRFLQKRPVPGIPTLGTYSDEDYLQSKVDAE
jgi:hypothetical protein